MLTKQCLCLMLFIVRKGFALNQSHSLRTLLFVQKKKQHPWVQKCRRFYFGGTTWYTTVGDQTKKSKLEVAWSYIEEAKGQFDTENVQYNLEGRKPVGRSKKTWKKFVEEDLKILGLEESQAFERDLWKLKVSSKPSRKGKNNVKR